MSFKYIVCTTSDKGQTVSNKLELIEIKIENRVKGKMMIIREYQPSDCRELANLFYETVHSVNAKDYTKEQLEVWAAGQADLEKWMRSFQMHYSLVADNHGVLIGFGDIDKTGYLDRLYVHKDYQRKGVATALCDKLEQTAPGLITTHASITAKPFFEKRGYEVMYRQQVERQGIMLTNFVMIKKMVRYH